MTNYIDISFLPKGSIYEQFANQVDKRKADINDPNDAAEANDNQLSQRELKMIEQKFIEYFTQKPEYDYIGQKKPAGLSASEAIRKMFEITGANYKQYQKDITSSSIAKFFKKLFS